MSATRDSLLAAHKLAAQVTGQISLTVERNRDLTRPKIVEWSGKLREAAEVLDRIGR